MREWITGRNPVFETLSAHRRQCFRIMLATGVEEKGVIKEILTLAKGINIPVERVNRQRLELFGWQSPGNRCRSRPLPVC